MQSRDRTNEYTTPKSSFSGPRSLSHAPTMSVLLEQCQSGRRKPSPWNWSVNSMEPAVFPPIHGDFGRQPQERCWKPTRIHSRRNEIKNRENREIAKSRRSSRSGGRTEGRRLQRIVRRGLELMFIDFKPSNLRLERRGRQAKHYCCTRRSGNATTRLG
jgi:hypothetical protein